MPAISSIAVILLVMAPCRQDRWHCNWNSSNQKHEQIINSWTISTVLNRVHNNNLDNHSHCNRAYAEVPNRMSCLPKECMNTSCNDHSINFALFHCRTRVNTISRGFCHGQGFTS
ncbi:olfactory receptor, partial [Striga asiatica]